MGEIRLVERDERIIRELDRWRVVQGRHIMHLTGFSGQSACDRRLRKLIQASHSRISLRIARLDTTSWTTKSHNIP